MQSTALTRNMTASELKSMRTYARPVCDEPVLSTSEWFREGPSFWNSILFEDSMTKAHIEINRRTVNCRCLSCVKMAQHYRFGKIGYEAEDNLIQRARSMCKQFPHFEWIFQGFLKQEILEETNTMSEMDRFYFNRLMCGWKVEKAKRDFVWWNDKKCILADSVKPNDIREIYIRKFFEECKRQIYLWELGDQQAADSNMQNHSDFF